MPDHADGVLHNRPAVREITRLPTRIRSSLPTYSNGWFRGVESEEVTADAAAGRFDIGPTRLFCFDQIRGGHRVMDADKVHGKIVVVHN